MGNGGLRGTDTSGSAVNISSFACSSWSSCFVERDGGVVVVVGGSQELIRRWEVARVRVARVKMVVGEGEGWVGVGSIVGGGGEGVVWGW